MSRVAKLFFAFVPFLVPTPSWSHDTTWYVLNKEAGCVSLGEVYEWLPYLRGGMNPVQLFERFRKRFSDATLQPFVSAIAQSHKSDGSVATREEREAYKGLTPENAFVIASVQWGDEMALFTEDACNSLGWLSGKSGSGS